jgi:hypothetical protein
MNKAAARWLIVVPAAAALAWLVLAALRAGTAGSTAYEAAGEIARWGAPGGAAPGKEAVARLTANLERARYLDPEDPDIEEMLGALALRRIDRPAFLDEGLAHYARAVELRPTSPYTWSAIVGALYRKGDTGRSFQVALRRAAELGPAEPEVQRTVADLGLATWDELDPDARRAVEAMVGSAMERDPAELLQIARRRGRLAVACRHLADAPRRVDPEALSTCSGRETTS